MAIGTIIGKYFGYGLIAVGVISAIVVNVRFGALCLGFGLAVKSISDLPVNWRRRPIEILAPAAFALALIILAIALPRSSA
jgi:hypothetical protein